jgi:hypothetical protein
VPRSALAQHLVDREDIKVDESEEIEGPTQVGPFFIAREKQGSVGGTMVFSFVPLPVRPEFIEGLFNLTP